MVVTNTLDDIAGSMFIFFNDTGTNIPKRPATIIFSTIEIEIINFYILISKIFSPSFIMLSEILWKIKFDLGSYSKSAHFPFR